MSIVSNASKPLRTISRFLAARSGTPRRLRDARRSSARGSCRAGGGASTTRARGTIARMRKLLVAALLVGVALVVGAAQGALPSGNLAVKGSAEEGAASTDGGVVPVPGWTTSGSFTVVQYEPGSDRPAARGANFFSSGPHLRSSAEQTIDLPSARRAIDVTRIDARLSVLIDGSGTLAVSAEDAARRTLS